jgi:CoA:oxalate CoA-transferase
LFAQLAKAIERPDLLERAEYRTNELRLEHVDQLETDLEQTLRTRPTSAWLDVLNAAGVPCGPVNTVADVARDPQVAARNMIVSMADPVIGKLQVAGNPIKLSGVAEKATHTPPPELDANRAEILQAIKRGRASASAGKLSTPNLSEVMPCTLPLPSTTPLA